MTKSPSIPLVQEIEPGSTSSDGSNSAHDDINATDASTELLSPPPKRPNLRTTSNAPFRAPSFSLKKLEFVREQNLVIRRRCQHELGAEASAHIVGTSHADILQWIQSERLTRLPHKGTAWDRVLSATQYFVEQVQLFEAALMPFIADSEGASQFIFGQCLLLLKLGHENAPALLKAINLFYNFGLDLSILLKRADLFQHDGAVREKLGQAYVGLLIIVSDVAVQYHQAVHGNRSSVTLDIYVAFKSPIDNFRHQVHELTQDMWRVVVASRDGQDVEELQRWLAPDDSVLAALASNHVNLGGHQGEYTCTWFQTHLVSFLRRNDSVLVVEGKAGSGKTTLAHWIRDRLQRPIARKSFSTLSFFLNASIAAQATSLSLVKTLLYQLLEIRIGDEALYLAVNDAFNKAHGLSKPDAQEEVLWQALHKSLAALSREQEDDALVLVVDGLDGIHGQKAKTTTNKLVELAKKHGPVRLILLAQQIDVSVTASRLILDASYTGGDIKSLIQHSLHNDPQYKHLSEDDRENVVDQLTTSAGDSILWATLAAKWLVLQTSRAAFDKAFEALKVRPGQASVGDIVQKLLGSLELPQDCKLLISWLIAAERPLRFDEVKFLMQAQPEHGIIADKQINMDRLLDSVKSFIVVGEGLIALRHNEIKQAFLCIKPDSPVSLHLKDRHREILLRLMIYAKVSQRHDLDVTFNVFERGSLQSRFRSEKLLEYCVRYWPIHFKKSSIYKSSGELELSEAFKRYFPPATSLAIFERACWYSAAAQNDILEIHELALRVRRSVFGVNHKCALQTALTCAFVARQTSRQVECAKYYHLSANISKIVLGAHSKITSQCCDILVKMTSTMITKKRTEIVTIREEVLLLQVEIYKHCHGASSQEVLEVYKLLVELYDFVGEGEKSKEIRIIIRQITVVVYGGDSGVSEDVPAHLHVELRKRKEVEDVDTYDDSFFSGSGDDAVEVWDLHRFHELILLAARYVASGHIIIAEELYIDIWLRLAARCRTSHEYEWHLKKVEFMLIYARFLEERKRSTEASSLLLCIWREYEFHEFSNTEKFVLYLRDCAVLLRTLEMLTVALRIFKKCWSFFKSIHQEHTVVFKQIEEHITVTSSEIIRSTKTSTSSTTAALSETVIREVFESSLSQTEMTSTTIELCSLLTSIYVKSERYFEASKTIKSVLKRSWTSFFSKSSTTVTITAVSETQIELVAQLAICYVKQSRVEKAEEIYLRLYHAIRSSQRLDHVLVIRYSKAIIELYEAHGMFNKAVTFYQQLLVEYRSFYGATHAKTIEHLYALADMCRRRSHTHGYWLEYYLEIVNVLNKEPGVCHHDALRAMIIVAETYFEESRFSESLTFYQVIAATFFKHGLEYKYFEQVSQVEEIFQHYWRCLRECKVENVDQIRVHKAYRETCLRCFGASASITITATMDYAAVCITSEEHQNEAISMYEHVSKFSSSKEVISTCKHSLKTLYIKQVNSSKSSTTVTKTMLESATSLTYERYQEVRKEYSCAHKLTLECIKDLVILYQRQLKQDRALVALRSLCVDIMTKTTSTKEMIECGRYIAEVYRSCAYVDYAHELVRSIKMQVIFKSTSEVEKIGFNIISIGRGCFPFVAALECYLQVEQVFVISECIAELFALSLYYERYTSAFRANAEIEEIFVAASKLRHVLGKHKKRLAFYGTIEHDVVEYFMKKETYAVKVTTKSAAHVLVSLVLEYFGELRLVRDFAGTSARLAIDRVENLLGGQKHKDAFELASCTFAFMMTHGALDEPHEISLGFRLCVLMAGIHLHSCKAADVQKKMVDLSRKILEELFGICEKNKIELSRLRIEELNGLICVLGEQKDYGKLEWLLTRLWNSREGQRSWSSSTNMALARRLIQASFTAGHEHRAIRLCEDIVYNVRRVHGARHADTLALMDLLAQLYTSAALLHLRQSHDNNAKDGQNANGNANGQRGQAIAKQYLQQALGVHERVLKTLADGHAPRSHSHESDSDISDSEDDLDSDIEGHGSGPSSPVDDKSMDEAHVAAARKHIRLLKLAFQRLGSWDKKAVNYERLTKRVWDGFGGEKGLKLQRAQVVVDSKWKAEAYGQGKAEASEGEFVKPVGSAGWKVL